MRIASNMMFEQMNVNMLSSQDALYEANQVVTTGKKISKPSDDPASTAKILDYNSIISNIDQYNRNIESVHTRLDLTQTSLAAGVKVLEHIQAADAGKSASNATAAERQETATTVSNYLSQLVDVANTRIGEGYIFSGFGGGAEPFDASGNAVGNISGDIKVKINKGFMINSNSPGDRVFKGAGLTGGVDVFKAVTDYITALNNNDTPGIQTAKDDLVKAKNQLNSQFSDVLARMGSIGAVKDQLAGVQETISKALAKEQNVDMNAAVTDFRAKETALDAARSASARVLNMSNLIDFLK